MSDHKIRTEITGFHQTGYDRKNTSVGVVHLGVGSFHRAHQAVYLDNFMEKSGQLNWAIAGVNLRKETSSDLRKLRKRNGEYFLKTLTSKADSQYQLVRSHKFFYDWAEDSQQAEDLVAQPSVKLMTITITESGYYLGLDSILDLKNIVIRNEIQGGNVSTVYGYLRNSLRKRKDQGNYPITILCCDNLRDNGNLLSKNLTLYLEAQEDHDLISWINDQVSFPCTMVDRITPRPRHCHSLEVEKKFGVRDDFTIHSEDFTQWVITDDFRGERPDLEMVDVSLVKDVSPYEDAKIRILNGAHLGLAYLGALKGFDTFDKTIMDPELSTFFDKLEETEILPSLDQNGPVNLLSYTRTIKNRFQNWQIADGLPRIAMDGYNKFRLFLLPTIEACFEMGIVPKYTIISVASWYVLMQKIVEEKSKFEYQDPYFSTLKTYLNKGNEHEFAKISEIWCDLPQKYPLFPQLVATEIGKLQNRFN